MFLAVNVLRTRVVNIVQRGTDRWAACLKQGLCLPFTCLLLLLHSAVACLERCVRWSAVAETDFFCKRRIPSVVLTSTPLHVWVTPLRLDRMPAKTRLGVRQRILREAAPIVRNALTSSLRENNVFFFILIPETLLS